MTHVMWRILRTPWDELEVPEHPMERNGVSWDDV